MLNQNGKEVLMMAIKNHDLHVKLEKLGNISATWVSGDRPLADFKAASKELAQRIGQIEIDQTTLVALDNFVDKVSVYLKDIDRRADNLHEEMMDAIPEGDD